MYRRYESYFSSEADGLSISLMAILPNKKPYRAAVQLVHGMSEHKERYIPFMEYLAGRGYVTVIHDQRGHGKSVKNIRDLGYMYGGGADAMLTDIGTVNEKIHEAFPGLPVILMGHSMGSLAVRAFAGQHDDCMDMLIVCGSPSKNPALRIGTVIASMEKKLFGARHKSYLLEAMSFGSYAVPFRKEKNKNAWICSDRQVYETYTESKLCGFTFTDDGYLALFELMRRAYDVKNWKCTNKKLPVLFIGGAKDPCIGGARKYAKAVRSMRTAGYTDVKGKLYPEMRHEILNEKNKEKVYRDVVVYLKKKGF